MTQESSHSSPFQILPLGGLGEIGMNCMVLDFDGQLLVLDCGVTFPGSAYGVDLEFPRFDWLVQHQERLAGIVLTHGHEDHIGALPYLLPLLDHPPPIYGPAYTLQLVTRRLREHAIEAELRELVVSEETRVGEVAITPLRVNHSMVDCTALCFEWRGLRILHSGDFKIEDAPIGEDFDFDGFRALGDRGVDLLMSDSTNVDVEGRTGDERSLAPAFNAIFEGAKGRVVVAQFASNGHRLELVVDAARRAGRKVCLLGRSLEQHAEALTAIGRLQDLAAVRVEPRHIAKLPRHQVCIIATGTQGERRAALSRLARGEHRDLQLSAGDSVVLSSRIIPGCEREVHEMICALERQEIEVHHRKTDNIHVSGHATRDEQRKLIQLVQPKAFLPVHGTYHHLKRHAELAQEEGVRETLIAENGAIIALRDGALSVEGSALVGHVSAERGTPLDERLVQERILMGQRGYAIAFVELSADRRIRHVEIRARGFLNERDEALLEDAERYVQSRLGRLSQNLRDPDALEDEASRALKRFFRRELGRQPFVDAFLLETE